MLRTDDPMLDRALQQGKPRAPREYRRARLHTLTYVALTVVVLALSVATSSWPAVSAGCVFTTIALSLAASVAAAGTGRDRPGER